MMDRAWGCPDSSLLRAGGGRDCEPALGWEGLGLQGCLHALGGSSVGLASL